MFFFSYIYIYEEVTVLLTWAAVFRDILCDTEHSLIDILITKLTKLKNPKFIGITRVTCLQAVIAVI